MTVAGGVHRPSHCVNPRARVQLSFPTSRLTVSQKKRSIGTRFEPATFEQGDWNGDGVFDQLDIVAALQTGNYLQGPYATAAVDPG